MVKYTVTNGREVKTGLFIQSINLKSKAIVFHEKELLILFYITSSYINDWFRVYTMMINIFI